MSNNQARLSTQMMSQYERLSREAQDEKIAQLLMEVEKRKIEEERISIAKDLEFARKLQEEENSGRAVPQPQKVIIKEEKKEDDLLQKQILRQLMEKKDQDYAQSLVREEERKIQEKKEAARKAKEAEQRKKQESDDEELARRLQTQLNIQAQPQPVHYNNNYVAPVLPIPAPPVYYSHNHNNVVNGHTQYIHNQYCGCTKRNSWDSNHIHKVHTQHCNCVAPYVGQYSNEGVVHQHTWKCCRKNHVHTIKCHCDYRSHNHTANCCTKYHVHNMYCNCSNK